jgi:hypothetical protein
MNIPELVLWSRVGESVAGKLVEIREGARFTNRQTRIADFRRRDGSHVSCVLTRTLEAKLHEQGVRVGSRVRIKYVGRRTSKVRGRPYKRFKVETR